MQPLMDSAKQSGAQMHLRVIEVMLIYFIKVRMRFDMLLFSTFLVAAWCAGDDIITPRIIIWGTRT